MFNLSNDADGNAKFKASGGGSETDGEFGVIFSENDNGTLVEAGFARGLAANTARTAVYLKRTDGTRVYLSVDTGTTLVVSTTHP